MNKKFKRNLWVFARFLYPNNPRAQALYVYFGFQKAQVPNSRNILKSKKIFPEFAVKPPEQKDEVRIYFENMDNWNKVCG